MERLRRVRDLHPLERAHGAQPKKPIEFFINRFFYQIIQYLFCYK